MRTLELQAAMVKLKDHAWFRKIYKRLSKDEEKMCMDFINTHGNLDLGRFEQAAARMFLDKPNKPKRWKEIVELLVNANSFTNKKEGAK